MLPIDFCSDCFLLTMSSTTCCRWTCVLAMSLRLLHSSVSVGCWSTKDRDLFSYYMPPPRFSAEDPSPISTSLLRELVDCKLFTYERRDQLKIDPDGPG